MIIIIIYGIFITNVEIWPFYMPSVCRPQSSSFFIVRVNTQCSHSFQAVSYKKTNKKTEMKRKKWNEMKSYVASAASSTRPTLRDCYAMHRTMTNSNTLNLWSNNNVHLFRCNQVTAERRIMAHSFFFQ